MSLSQPDRSRLLYPGISIKGVHPQVEVSDGLPGMRSRGMEAVLNPQFKPIIPQYRLPGSLDSVAEYEAKQTKSIAAKVKASAVDKRGTQGGRGPPGQSGRGGMGARNTYAAAVAHTPPLVPATVATLEAIQEAKESARQSYQAIKSDLQEEFSTKFADLGAKLDTVLERTQVTDAVLFDRAQDGTVVNRLDTFSEMAVALNTGSVILHEGLGQLHRTQKSMQAVQERQGAVQEAQGASIADVSRHQEDMHVELRAGRTDMQVLTEQIRINNELFAKSLADRGNDQMPPPTG